MNYEEKYNAALQRARALNNGEDIDVEAGTTTCEYIFPELKESRDEKIKREILELVSIAGNGNQFEEIKDWLEKQGEQKPSDKTEPKFRPGDWVIDNFGDTYQIESATEIIAEHIFGYTIVGGGYFNDNSDVRLWSIADAKDGDVLYSPCLRLLWIFKSKDTIYCGCNLNYNDGAFCGEGYFERPTDAIPATKEQRDAIERAMTNAGYEWDGKKKELKKIEHKMFNPDKVIEWLNDQACLGWIEDVEVDKFVDKFKKDFGL